MELYDFIEHTRDKHLTLNDVKALKIGDTLDVVIWDRNFEEARIWNSPEGKEYTPKWFFADNRVTLTYLGNLEWDMVFAWDTKQKFRHEVHVDTIGLNKKGHTWCPVCNGKITCTRKSVDKLPGTTRVGWRGPAMLWSNLGSNPKVYWNSDEED